MVALPVQAPARCSLLCKVNTLTLDEMICMLTPQLLCESPFHISPVRRCKKPRQVKSRKPAMPEPTSLNAVTCCLPDLATLVQSGLSPLASSLSILFLSLDTPPLFDSFLIVLPRAPAKTRTRTPCSSYSCPARRSPFDPRRVAQPCPSTHP